MNLPANVFPLAAVFVGIGLTWYQYVYLLPKAEYNRVHPYTSWIPITGGAGLRWLGGWEGAGGIGTHGPGPQLGRATPLRILLTPAAFACSPRHLPAHLAHHPAVFFMLRNLTPPLRTFSMGLYGWLGCITLETCECFWARLRWERIS